MRPVSELRFDEWCSIVCGNYRLAEKSTLEDLWAKAWKPQQAIEHLQKNRLFKRRPKDAVPFWDAWREPKKARKSRQHTLTRFDLQCRFAEALMRSVRAAREHRMEEAEMRFCDALYKQCANQLAERDRLKRERKAERIARKRAAEDAQATPEDVAVVEARKKAEREAQEEIARREEEAMRRIDW